MCGVDSRGADARGAGTKMKREAVYTTLSPRPRWTGPRGFTEKKRGDHRILNCESYMRVMFIVWVVAASCAAVWAQVVDEQKPDWAYAVAPAPPPGGGGPGGAGRGGRGPPHPAPPTSPA